MEESFAFNSESDAASTGLPDVVTFPEIVASCCALANEHVKKANKMVKKWGKVFFISLILALEFVNENQMNYGRKFLKNGRAEILYYDWQPLIRSARMTKIMSPNLNKR